MKRTLRPLLVLAFLAIACGGAPDEGTGNASTGSIVGLVHAGPVCPVEQNPPDPNCADRPVANAVLVVLDADGAEAARLVSAGDGTFSADLPAGSYTLVPQSAEGLMGIAGAQDFTVAANGTTTLDVSYDTGIR